MSTFAESAPPNAGLDARVASAVEVLHQAQRDYGRVVYASSLGAESIVLTDLIWTRAPGIDLFTIDTGRLPEATLALLAQLEHHYQRRLPVYYPEARAVEQFVADHGINGFRDGLAQRQRCCAVRKLEPFGRAIAGYGAWITGLRREQSAERAGVQASERDTRYGLQKVSPLLDWSSADIWAYIRTARLPYNALHDQRYASIGCAPCTRPVEPGEDERAGRWWWEHAESRECGLQPRRPAPRAD